MKETETASTMHNNSELVSIIIPVYMVEPYLNRCVASVVAQTYNNLEIILIDDGSTDHCPEMCEDWARRDSRIRVIHKRNEGLGKTRSLGIVEASGDYICFVDSDDYLSEETIEQALSALKKHEAEIAIFGYQEIDRNGNVKRLISPNTKKDIYRNEEIKQEFLPALIGPDTETGERPNLWMSVCCCLFSMDLLHKCGWRLASEREIIAEDVYSLLKLYNYVSAVAVVRKPLYCYCFNASSLSRKYRSDRFEKIKEFYQKSVLVCEENNYPKVVKDRLAYPFFSFVIGTLKILTASDLPYAEKKAIVKEIVYDQLTCEIFSNLSIRHEKLQRKILLLAMKYRRVNLCLFLLRLKGR